MVLPLTDRVEEDDAPFLAKVDVDSRREQRRARRFIADQLDALQIGRGSKFDVIIHNMSETGFLAEFQSDLDEGDEVRLKLDRVGFVSARIVWKRGLGHGCEFRRRVPEEVVRATIAARHPITPVPVPVASIDPSDQRSAMPFVILSALLMGLVLAIGVAWAR